ncbi:hypothetical protein DVH24_008079 [Malus domestica]|uniref:Uncharacterized protein n=1 Tax=Malus domestica TaxID=3750 RepID=A0A498JI86_MALDO|nr:hypothetical protein DVH24_008079 [Malus domestica]
MEAAPPCPEEEASTELTFWTTNKKRKPEAEFPNLKHEKVTLDDHNTNKKASDLGNLLILETNFVKNVVFSCLGDKNAERVETKAGARLAYLTTSRTVHDCNTFSKHRMILKLLESPAKSYAFDEDWNQSL